MRGPHRHEPVRIYGTAVSLPAFTLRRRMLWWLLLTVARFDWGQKLIRRARGL